MRQDRSLRAFTLSALVWVAVAAVAPAFVRAAGERAADILKRAVLARGQVSYSGVATLRESDPHEGARTFTEVLLCKQGGKQKVQVKDADGRLVVLKVCDGNTLWEQYLLRNAVVKRPVPSTAERQQRDLQNLDILLRNFSATVAGLETVAGRKAYRIRISRPGQAAIVRQFWIDQGNYLELRSEQYAGGSAPVSSMAMTRVNFAPDFPAGVFAFQPPPNVQPRVADDAVFRGSLGDAEKRAGFTAIQPKTMPAGFELLSRSVAVVSRSGSPALWLRYTNGIDSFSLFQRRAAGDVGRAKGRWAVREWQSNGYQFLLVGHLPQDQIDAIRGSYP